MSFTKITIINDSEKMKILFNAKKYASYYQFYLEDAESTENAENICIDANFEKSLGVGYQMIVINTARYAEVDVSLTLYKSEPKLDLEEAEKINECSLLITSKLKLGSEVSSDWTEYEIEKGIYRVRILYKNLSSVVGDNGDDSYHIQIWKDDQMRETKYLK